MIKTENLTFGGIQCVRTYSDTGCYIERNGQRYEEAIDPADTGRMYTETDIPIEGMEATEADYLSALDRLGVSVDD